MANGYAIIKDFINQNRNTNIPDGYTDKELITFRPVECLQSDLVNITPVRGCVYFTTDTKRIYIVKDSAFISMGGNSGIYYARQSWDTGATSPFRFDYGSLDINQDVDIDEYTIPLENDLIFNYVDRSFYRVLGEAIDTDGIAYLQAERLAVSGSGGGGGEEPGGGSGSLSIITDPADLSQRFYLRKGDTYKIRFLPKATDKDGSITGDGNGILTITSTGQKINLPTVSNGNWNEIDITSYLQDGRTDVKLQVYMDIGDGVVKQGTKTWKLNIFTTELTWDLDETIIYSDSTIPLSWSSTGQVNKKTKIKIDDTYVVENIPETNSIFAQSYSLNREEYNLVHGVHKIAMWIEVNLGNTTIKTNEVVHNIITIDENNENPIISINYFDSKIRQYDTVEIPIIIYDPTKEQNDTLTSIKIIEDLKELNTWNEYINGTKEIYTYIPTEAGTKVLMVSYKGAEATITFDVESLDLIIKEVEGYAFRFKPGELGSNAGIQQWDSNGVNFEFSENFDWINGGLKTEKDDNGNIKSYFLIKAGNTATINYQPFSNDKNLNNKGFCFKIIYKATQCRDFNAQVLSCYDERIGLLMKAQNAIYKSANTILEVPYCEDTYMEFEIDMYPNLNTEQNESGKRYFVSWLDGVPSSAVVYPVSDITTQYQPQKIVIGSPECDVQVYLIKHYPKHLTNEEHLNNFIMDAPNPAEMMERFRRNDILGDNGDISYEKLIAVCPNLPIHVYDVSRMTTGKTEETKVKDCKYNQYLGSITPHIHAEGVTIKAQGTSSLNYILAAANIDSDFKKCSVLTQDGEKIDEKVGWSMDDEAIPINYWNTKVNVASCESANNAIFQEWYNRFQPYKSIARRKWEAKGNRQKMRDTMEFKPGLMFLIDRNPNINKESVSKMADLNVFADTPGYINSPYAKLYSICNMGNSKKNFAVFHDLDNHNECCIEVADNQMPYQKMVDIPKETEDKSTHWDEIMNDGGFDIRYSYETKIEGAKVPPKRYCDAWKRLVSWMAKSDPCSKWREAGHGNKLTQEEFNNLHKDKNIYYYVGLDRRVIMPTDDAVWDKDTVYYTGLISETRFNNYRNNGNILYTLVPNKDWDYSPVDYTVDSYDANTQYYLMTEHVNGYTGKELKEEEKENFAPYTFKPGNYGDGDSRVLEGYTIADYQGSYTTDCYKYRMAKMLKECEDYLIMDSLVYHYLMIERHSLVDNVAKNTFWTCENVGPEDSNHKGELWQMVKDYDNDTAAGIDNLGNLALHYGYECLDVKDNTNVNYDMVDSATDVFNAKASVWLNFISGLPGACKYMQSQISGAWDTQALLKEFNEWQDQIPERVWIEDYYRKYFRPREFFKDSTYLEKLAGGKKTHQRKRFETYQGYYIDSKYVGTDINNNNINLRANKKAASVIEIPLKTYCDCYIQCALGSGMSPNFTKRVKAGEEVSLFLNVKDLNDATFYLYPGNLYQKVGDMRGNQVLGLGALDPKQLSLDGATRLRECYLDYSGVAEGGTTSFSSPILEKVVFINNPHNNAALDLSNLTGLKYLDTTGSHFSEIKFADYAPIEYLHMGTVGGLQMSNLLKIKDFEVNGEKFTSLNLNNIDQLDKKTYPKTVNSKEDIIDKGLASQEFIEYRLNNVKWNLNEDDAMTVKDGISHIDFLDTIYKAWKPSATAGATDLNKITGVLFIPEGKYNDNKSLDIYNYYKKLFPGLDLNFEDSNAKLYNINIYDSSHSIVAWTSKTNKEQIPNEEFYKNNNLTEALLKSQNITQKTATQAKTYTFTNTWEIKTNDGGHIEFIKSATYPVFTHTISQDVNCYPIFKEADRLYTVSFYDEKGKLVDNSVKAKYGTKVSDAISLFEASHTPAKDDSQLGAYNTYVFRGYSLNQGSTTLVNGNSSLVRNISLYYVFEEVDVRTFDFTDYFEVFNLTSSGYDGMWNNITKNYDEKELPGGNSSYNFIDGVVITAKKPLVGKVCIPNELNGKKVVGISRRTSINTRNEAMNNTYYNGLTHLFFLDNSECRFIFTSCFAWCQNLKCVYLPKSLRVIGAGAFEYCNSIDISLPQTNLFPSELLIVGQKAFSIAFGPASQSKTVLLIPGTITTIGALAIANNSGMKQQPLNKIQIGSKDPDDFSQWVSTNYVPYIGSNYPENDTYNFREYGCIKQNPGEYFFNNIDFYTKNYTDASSVYNARMIANLPSIGELNIING